MTPRLRLIRRLLLLTAVVIGTACAASNKPRGALMIVVSADMSIPKDMNRVVVEVLNDNGNKHSLSYPITPEKDGKNMPGTLSIVPPDGGGQHVRVRVIAERASSGNAPPTPRIVRDAILNIPTDRVVTVPMPLRWLCDGHFTPTADGSYQPDCASDQTCAAGKCVSAIFDSAALPTYDPRHVFGGGNEQGVGGTCEDVSACFSGARTVTPDAECTLAVPPGASADRLNIAMVPKSRDGVCETGSDSACYIPLDHDAKEGWTINGGRISLPSAVCTDLRMGTIRSLSLSVDCPAKDSSVPLCGPWTPVGAADAGVDASTDASAGGADAGSSVDAGSAGAAGEGPAATDGCAASGTCPIYRGTSGYGLDIVADDESVYWISDSGTVTKRSIKGGNPVLLASGQDQPITLALDDANVYWINGDSSTGNPTAGKVMKVPLGGGKVTTLATGQSKAAYMLVSGDNVYWSGGTATISRVPIAGGPAEILVPGAGTPSQPGFAVDAHNIYWATRTNTTNTLMKVPLLGIPKGGVAAPLTSVPSSVTSIAIDANSVYFRAGGIMKTPIDGTPDGGAPVRIATAGDPGVSSPRSLLVEGSSVYWYEAAQTRVSPSFPGLVQKAPVDGVDSTPVPVATDLGTLRSFAVNRSAVFWSDDESGILSAPLTGIPKGGAPTAINVTLTPKLLASNGSTLLLAGETSLASMPVTGGPAELLASGLLSVQAVALDAKDAYFAAAGSSYSGTTTTTYNYDGSVGRVPLSGGPPVTISNAIPDGIALDSSGLYWSDADDKSAYIRKLPHGASTPTLLVQDGSHGRFQALSVDAKNVYFSGSNTFLKAPLSGLASDELPTVLVTGNFAFPHVNKTGIYYVIGDQTNEYVVRAPLDGVPEGGTPEVLASVPTASSLISDLAIDDANLYIAYYSEFGSAGQTATTKSSVSVLPLDGSASADAGTGKVVWQGSAYEKLAIDDGALYVFSDTEGVSRISPKPLPR